MIRSAFYFAVRSLYCSERRNTYGGVHVQLIDSVSSRIGFFSSLARHQLGGVTGPEHKYMPCSSGIGFFSPKIRIARLKGDIEGTPGVTVPVF
jgi:hypothetical protein